MITEKDEKTPAPEEKKPTEKKKPKKKPEGDFKRKYFEYYDDIKISDRQDW